MKSLFIDKCLNIINKYNPDYNDTKLAEIKYGLESIYILVSKTIIIFSIAYFFNLIKELLIFVLIYNVIKMPSFGLHATKSWICLIGSIIIFLTIPYLCQIIEINLIYKSLIGIVCILLIYKNAPADTYKRPIINKKRREIYKFLSTSIAISFTTFSLIIANNFLSNSLIMALILQCFIISPLVYKAFGLPYNNYLRYR